MAKKKYVEMSLYSTWAGTSAEAPTENRYLMVLKGGFACEVTAAELTEWHVYFTAHPMCKRWEAAWVKEDRAAMLKIERQLFNVGKKWFAGLVKRRTMKPAEPASCVLAGVN